jgi:preprotein translocase subunit SecF
MFKITQRRNLYFILSGIIIIPGIVFMIMGGLKLGIDFTGGSLINIGFTNTRPSVQQIEETLGSLQLGPLTIQPLGDKDASIKLKNIDNETYTKVIAQLKEKYGEITEKSFDSIGPTFGNELKQKAITATILVLIFILLYISFAFRKASFGPVKSWVFGAGAIIALIHDLILVIGFFAFLGKFWNVEVDTLFITALLTILGFSVHDTIVVYDRIRERLRTTYNKTFEETVNESVNQTIVRSLNTSLTTLLVLLALYLFGGQSIRFFILALLVGITAGTYSSIFIASPLLVVWSNFTKGKE